MTNVFISKWPVAKECRTLVPTKFFKRKFFQPTLQITTPIADFAERPIISQMSQKEKWSTDQLQTLPFSLYLSKYNDIKGSAIIADGNKISCIIPLSKKNEV